MRTVPTIPIIPAPGATARPYLTRVFTVTPRLTARAHQRIEEVLEGERCLYNAALRQRIEAYRNDGRSIGFAEQCRWLTGLRADMPNGIGSVHRSISAATLRRLDRAYDAFFRRVKSGDEPPGFPKPMIRNNTLECGNNDKAQGMLSTAGRPKLVCKGLPIMPFRTRRDLPDTRHLVGWRLTRNARRIVLQLTYEAPSTRLADVMLLNAPESLTPHDAKRWIEGHMWTPVTQPVNPVGVDLGVNVMASLSDGAQFDGLRPDIKREKRLQRAMSRSRKGSETMRKRVRSLGKEKHRIASARKGVAHQVSRAVVGDHDIVAVEALHIRNMTRSAKGTVENPGKNVAQKSGLNRSILEQGWGDLRRKIEYKITDAGGMYVEVDPAYTSQTCSGCGVINASATKADYRTYKCPDCGLSLDRDVNAARNVLRRGLASVSGKDMPDASAAR